MSTQAPRSGHRAPGQLLLLGLALGLGSCKDDEKTDEALYSELPFPEVEMHALIRFTTFPVDMAAATVAWLITPGCAESLDEGVSVVNGDCAGYLGTAQATAPDGVLLPELGSTLDIDWRGWGVETALMVLTMDGSAHAEFLEGDRYFSRLQTDATGTFAGAESGLFPVEWRDYVASDLGAWIEGSGELTIQGQILAEGIGEFTVDGQLSRSLACPSEPDGRVVLSGDARGDIVLVMNGRRSCDGCLKWTLGDASGTWCVEEGRSDGGGWDQEEGDGSCYIECPDGPICGYDSVDQAQCEEEAARWCGGAELVVNAEHVDCEECDSDCDPEWYP